MASLLESIPFRDPARAREDIARLGAGIPAPVEARLKLLLESLPDPDEALHYLERFRREAPGAFERVLASPAALQYLLTIFSYSRFLSDALVRYPESILQLAGSGRLYRVLSAEEYAERLLDFLGPESRGVPQPLELARFRRRQILRIVLRDALGLATLSDVAEELSNLADAILDIAYARIRDELVGRYGEPLLADGAPCGFSVLALGKLGGRELNYSSDIDLMFLYGANGETGGPNRITNKEFFKKVANRLTELLSTYTPEGLCYRVDLRLRPEGRFGEVAVSTAGALNYYSQRARDWEKQMLIKGRACAGEPGPGQELLQGVEELIYASTLDFSAVEAVSETRQRIGEKLAGRRSPSGLDVKLAPGGIRDIEFLVQCLQRLHGGRETWVRHGGTLLALFRLRDKGLLSGVEYARLANAYQFLRHLEHRLQFDEDRQVHTLPASPRELEILARKMPRGGSGEMRGAAWLESAVREHLGNVRELYERVIHAQQPMYYTAAEAGPAEPEPAEDPAPNAAVNLQRFLDQRAPQLARSLAAANLHRGRERFDHYLEKALADAALLDRLDSDPALAARAVDLFEHSQYFGDQLLRYPELLLELADGAAPGEEALEDPAALRRHFRRSMCRVQAASLFGPEPIFTTLERTSDLADSVIAAAYRMALRDAPPPANPAYQPHDQMMVITLGRLGMREFDLASDADLVFVIPDRDAAEQVYWTGVAERTIHTISAYTGEGVMFAVDTRLRPNGREGALVQPESSYKTYFAKQAEAWEGIAYMKSRAVAGNVERATDFLHELQEVDWRRYGQSGRSRKELAQMRARLEKEQGSKNPLKAGPGGYYDIDFVLMYLRLKGAGIFYKVLNTPARIDVIEKMGHLDREDADFLRDAAAFYRSIDHGQRLATGRAAADLPTSQAQLETLAELARRWIPEPWREMKLESAVAEIRRSTRTFYSRLFGQ
ncbi:MAG: glutamine-synthetase adenylyltransferase [Bryobacteraceae bacterium]